MPVTAPTWGARWWQKWERMGGPHPLLGNSSCRQRGRVLLGPAVATLTAVALSALRGWGWKNKGSKVMNRISPLSLRVNCTWSQNKRELFLVHTCYSFPDLGLPPIQTRDPEDTWDLHHWFRGISNSGLPPQPRATIYTLESSERLVHVLCLGFMAAFVCLLHFIQNWIPDSSLGVCGHLGFPSGVLGTGQHPVSLMLFNRNRSQQTKTNHGEATFFKAPLTCSCLLSVLGLSSKDIQRSQTQSQGSSIKKSRETA